MGICSAKDDSDEAIVANTVKEPLVKESEQQQKDVEEQPNEADDAKNSPAEDQEDAVPVPGEAVQEKQKEPAKQPVVEDKGSAAANVNDAEDVKENVAAPVATEENVVNDAEDVKENVAKPVPKVELAKPAENVAAAKAEPNAKAVAVDEEDEKAAFNAQQYVDETVSSGSVVMIAKSDCKFCKEALVILEKYSKNVIKKEIDVDFQESDMGQITDYCKALTGEASVPRIFIDGKFVGGCDDAKALDEKGELKTLIENATKAASKEE